MVFVFVDKFVFFPTKDPQERQIFKFHPHGGYYYDMGEDKVHLKRRIALQSVIMWKSKTEYDYSTGIFFLKYVLVLNFLFLCFLINPFFHRLDTNH